jgi:hypothetical protein
LKDVTRDEFQRGQLVTVDFSADAKTLSRTLEIVVPKSARWGDLLSKLNDKNFLKGETGHIRALYLAEGVFETATEATPLHQVKKVWLSAGRQERSGKLLFVTRAVVDATQYCEPCGIPAGIVFADDVTLERAKAEIIDRLGLNDEQAKKAKFFLGAKWVHFAPVSEMKDEALLGTLSDGATIYVVVGAKRRAVRRAQPEITIEN